MTRFIFIIISSLSICVGIKAQQTVTSYDGQVFTIGDRIQLGNPALRASEYRELKQQSENNNSYYSNLKTESYPFSFVTIEEIKQEEKSKIFFDSEPVLLVKSEVTPDKNILIHLNSAIHRGEIISKTSDNPLYDTAILLTRDKMIACCLRVNQLILSDNVILYYINSIDPELGRECEQNKFTFIKLKDEYKTRLEKEMKKFDFSKTYLIEVKGYRENYDFDKQGYSLQYNIRNPHHPRYFIEHDGFNFFIPNNEKHHFLAIDAETAEKYELRNKGPIENGYSDGLLYFTVFLKLKDERMELPKKKNEIIDTEKMYRHTLIGSDVVAIDVFDNDSFKYNFLGTVK
jgi:hypothetical protein